MTSNGDKLAFECRGMMIQMGEKTRRLWQVFSREGMNRSAGQEAGKKCLCFGVAI